jgi:hypothetical protein
MDQMNKFIRRTYQLIVEEFRIEGWSDPRNRWLIIVASVFAIIAFLIRIFFWQYTGRTWEDALITVLHSENFANGLGLTHYLTGQSPVHGFTSPLGVLVPLIGDLVKVGYGLSLIKLVSAVCGSIAVIFVAAIGIHPKFNISRILLILPIGFVALDYNQIIWGMSGLETQMVTTILLMSIYYLLREKLFATGILLGLCLLARPDMVFWVIIVGIYLLFTQRMGIVKAIIPAAIIYLPWLIFTTSYYGSFVPNTMIAKYVGYGWKFVRWDPSIFGLMYYVIDGVKIVFRPLGPVFGGHGWLWLTPFDNSRLVLAGMQLFEPIALLFIFIAICFILLQKRKGLVPVVLFVVVYAGYYIFLVAGIFDWYLIPLAAVGILLCAYGIHKTIVVFINPRFQKYLLASIAAIWLISLVIVIPKDFKTERQIQLYIEDDVRKEIGLYLSTVMEKDQSIGLEPLGYIGYYSRRTVYDYPGLCNRKVVDYLKTLPPSQRNLYSVSEHFKPDYLVLRKGEYEWFQKIGADPWVLRDYQVIRWFEADPAKTKDIWGIGWNIDTSFVVLKKSET